MSKPRRFVTLRFPDGEHRARATFYGIWAVHERPWVSSEWTVTHAPSGRSVVDHATERDAHMVALLLATRLPEFQYTDPDVRTDEIWDWCWIDAAKTDDFDEQLELAF